MANSKNTRGAPIGNQNAAKSKIWSDALRKAVIQGDHLSKLADALILKALEGDISAIRELGDRLEGKVTQSIEQNTNLNADVEIYSWQE
jgi:hypothetical protein